MTSLGLHTTKAQLLAVATLFLLNVLFLAQPSSAAQIVVQYDANPGPAPNPGTVDANLVDAGNQFWSGFNHGSAVNDGGTPAWQTIDNSSSPVWSVSVPLANITEGSTNGWKLSWNVKALLVSTAYNASQSPTIAIFDVATSAFWRMGVGAQADGDQEILLDSNTSAGVIYAAEGEGEVYHLYELVFDPSTSTGDLFVDGVERISNFAGPTLSGSSVDVFWGDGSTSTSLERVGNHNLVQWETIPEPSTLTLAAFGFAALAAWGWRRRSN